MKSGDISSGIELLDVAQIHYYLPPLILQRCKILVYPEVDSTNQMLLDQHHLHPTGSFVFAEYQTQGRGRRQRKWYAPFGSSLCFSVLWNFDRKHCDISGLSLATAVAVVNAIEKMIPAQLQLKWPNDILWNAKKLAGILIEIPGERRERMPIVIGVGLNVCLPAVSSSPDWTDLATMTQGSVPSRNRLAAYLIIEIIAMLQLFTQQGFSPFKPIWQALDAFYDKPVRIITPNQVFEGVAKGINDSGALCLALDSQQELYFLQGEVSLRPAVTLVS